MGQEVDCGLWREENLLSKETEIPRAVSRAEKYRRAITPEVQNLRVKGRKGGKVVPQPLTRKILKPLNNSFGGLRIDASGTKVKTLASLRNSWFIPNKTLDLTHSPQSVSPTSTLTSGSYSPIPLRRSVSIIEEREVVQALSDDAQRVSSYDSELAELVANTRGKYKMGKWIPHAEVCRGHL